MDIVSIVIQIFVVLFAITIHEASHGWAAFKMGDPTAYNLGRVSINPIVHIDPIGTILLPILLPLLHLPAFGWAKPVPVNPYNLRNPRRDHLFISAAGPLANLLTALGALVLLLVLKFISPSVAVFLRNFELSRTALPAGFYPLEGLAMVLFWAVMLNAYLAVFNLIPVPPLDGSGVLMGLLSDEAAQKYDRIRPFGFIIVLALIYLNVLGPIFLLINVFVSLVLR